MPHAGCFKSVWKKLKFLSNKCIGHPHNDIEEQGPEKGVAPPSEGAHCSHVRERSQKQISSSTTAAILVGVFLVIDGSTPCECRYC